MLYSKNKIYTGYDGHILGFQSSSSISSSAFSNIRSGSFYLSSPSDLNINGKTYTPFSGSFQELRFYNFNLDEDKFDDYVMNPYSIEGNEETGTNTSLNKLIFRAPLGTVLDNDISLSTRISVHPSISKIPSTSSFFISSSNFTSSIYTLNGVYSFSPQTEIIYQKSFNSGIKNTISEKIKITNSDDILDQTLSQYISIQQEHNSENNFNKNINYIEVGFSPQDEVNDDIIEQLGFFNIGNYIGDPRQISSSLTFYPDLNRLRDEYFSKYISNYNLWDYIRLIKFYDNSLFKMIQDFTPSKSSLSTGIIIKQTMLERNKYPLPQINTDSSLTTLG